jgi:hypothetical protein
MITWIAEMWCKTVHNRPMWPIHGKYICERCLREFDVPWTEPVLHEEYARPDLRPEMSPEMSIARRTVPAVQ